jgi:predicted phage tail protein
MGPKKKTSNPSSNEKASFTSSSGSSSSSNSANASKPLKRAAATAAVSESHQSSKRPKSSNHSQETKTHSAEATAPKRIYVYKPVLTHIVGRRQEIRPLGTFHSDAEAYRRLLKEVFNESSLFDNLWALWNEQDNDDPEFVEELFGGPPSTEDLQEYFTDLWYDGYLRCIQNLVSSISMHRCGTKCEQH